MVVMCVRVLIGNVCVLVGSVEMDKLCCVCVCVYVHALVSCVYKREKQWQCVCIYAI
jgi:hypothetical protein